MGNGIEQLNEKGIEVHVAGFGERRKVVFRGEIWMANLGYDNKEAGEQKGYRPVVVIQNDRGNKHSPTVIVASITGSSTKTEIPTHQEVDLQKHSTIMFEQIFTLSKDRLNKQVGRLDEAQLMEANYRMAVSLGLVSC